MKCTTPWPKEQNECHCHYYKRPKLFSRDSDWSEKNEVLGESSFSLVVQGSIVNIVPDDRFHSSPSVLSILPSLIHGNLASYACKIQLTTSHNGGRSTRESWTTTRRAFRQNCVYVFLSLVVKAIQYKGHVHEEPGLGR